MIKWFFKKRCKHNWEYIRFINERNGKKIRLIKIKVCSLCPNVNKKIEVIYYGKK